MVTLGILLSAGIVTLLEFHNLSKLESKRDTIVFVVLLLAATGLLLAIGHHLPVPNPMEGLLYLLGPLNRWLDAVL